VLDIEAELDEEIDQQPHVVEQDGEPEVEQPDGVVLGRRPGEEVLDRLVGVLDAPPAAVPVDHALGVLPLRLSPGLDVLVRHEGDRLLGIRRRGHQYEVSSCSLVRPTTAHSTVDRVVLLYLDILLHPPNLPLDPLVLRRRDDEPDTCILECSDGVWGLYRSG